MKKRIKFIIFRKSLPENKIVWTDFGTQARNLGGKSFVQYLFNDYA